jgi:hypothetical protein
VRAKETLHSAGLPESGHHISECQSQWIAGTSPGDALITARRLGKRFALLLHEELSKKTPPRRQRSALPFSWSR